MSADTNLVFSLLGPLRGWRGDQEVDLGSPQQRLVLAVLLVDGGRSVHFDAIADALWSEAPPRSPRATIRTYIHRLRAVLGPDAISSEADGYAVRRDHVIVDLQRLTALLSGPLPDDDRIERARALKAALHVWREAPLSGLRGDFADAFRRKMADLRLDAVERLAVLLAEAGEPGPVHELADAVRLGPTRERLRELLMRALYQAGRRTEALEVYSEFERVLRSGRGGEPSPELRCLHVRMLAGVPLRGADAIPPPTLPAALPAFVGRDDALAELDVACGRQPEGKVVLVTGMAGVGKSTLVLRWANQAADRFPDGQIYVDLCGFDAESEPLDSVEVLTSVLESSGCVEVDIPRDVDALVALYQVAFSGRRCLIVLDNARDAEQVQLLLPVRSQSTVLIASRARLDALREGVRIRTIQLDVPDPAEAAEMFTALTGRAEVEGAPETAARIVDLCGQLPLALSLVGARVRTLPGLSLPAIAAELDANRGSLSAFACADAAADLRTVLECSYRTLSSPAARSLTVLATLEHPGTFTAERVAEVLGVPLEEAHGLLRELGDANMVVVGGSGQYSLHGLVRAYASELRGERVGEPQLCA